MKPVVLAGFLLLGVSSLAEAQPANLTGAALTVRQADRDFVRQAQALAEDPAAHWIGWEAPSSGERSSCCWSSSDGWGSGACCGRCRLDPGTGRTVTQAEGSRPVRLEDGGVLRIFAREPARDGDRIFFEVLNDQNRPAIRDGLIVLAPANGEQR